MSVKIQASDPSKVKLAAGKLQLVEFFAYWSGPSLAMAPIVKGIESEYRGEVGFVYLDIDNPATRLLRAQLHFHTVPHFFLLDERGKILKEWVGYISYEKLRQAIDGAID
jgi:thioredoxin-like negative regulator of GroEL